LRRVRNLERAGVIRGYHAAVDPAAMGRGFQILLHVEMVIQDADTTEAFERAVAQVEEVTECRRMFGQPDYLLSVAVADAAAYERLLLTELARLPGVARTNSQLTMKLVKATRAAGGPTPSSRAA
jgi:DNA-binding Lrp family transcriptional regulator